MKNKVRERDRQTDRQMEEKGQADKHIEAAKESYLKFMHPFPSY